MARLETRLVMMLVDKCAWKELALRRHGLTAEKLLELARNVATDGLRRRGAVLGDRYDDLVSRLVIVGLHEAMTYDPQRQGLGYGRNGGSVFIGYLSDVMDHRIDDFYRARSEGFSDRRYKNFAEVTPSAEIDTGAEQQVAVEEAIERLDSASNLEWYMAAAEEEGLPLHDWVIRALNERASRSITRPSYTRRQVERERQPGPDHWPGQKVEVA
jgi:hypothetical protein